MTIRHLKIFVTVCKRGSTIEASKELLIAQPSISLAIKELENYYGIRLFDRIGKRLHITEAGKKFFQHAIHIVNQFEDMEKGIKNLDSKGLIRIGASITIGNYLLPKYVADFLGGHSDIDVKVYVGNSNIVQQHILDNTLDLGLIEEGLVHNPYIVSNDFYEDELVFICAKNHDYANKNNIKMDDLLNQKFILREVGSAGRNKFDGVMVANGITIEPMWESTSTQAIIRAVQSELGISILPYLLVKDKLFNEELSRFRVSKLSFKRKFSIIYHKNKFITKGARDFINLCY